MEHEYKEYLTEIDKAIEELATMRPTAERIKCMHDYLYVKRHLPMHKADAHKADTHKTEASDTGKSYFGG